MHFGKQCVRLANDLNIYMKQAQKVTERKHTIKHNHAWLLYDSSDDGDIWSEASQRTHRRRSGIYLYPLQIAILGQYCYFEIAYNRLHCYFCASQLMIAHKVAF